MRNKRTTKVTAELRNLNKDDIYSLLLFTLYKMRNNPDYLLLSDMCYILDGDSFTKLLSYFGGMTIKIPTLHEFRLLIQTISVYQYVTFEKGNLEEGIKAAAGSEFETEEIRACYAKILEVIEDYDFGKED